MELCCLKGDAFITLKSSLPTIYTNYLRERDNSWVVDVCGENPFVKFRDVPDFELAPLGTGLDKGTIDFRNSKILYKNLHFLTSRQAADERFWAGFCHGAFYDYVRKRWDYDKVNDLRGINKAKTIKELRNRFFFDGGSRERILTNTLSKYWWAGRVFTDEALDALGSSDFYSKLFSIVTRSFIANEKLRGGFVKFLQHFKGRGAELDTDKHIRPAMIELNKVGGAIVLDCLTESEVAAILIEYVEKIFAARKVVCSVQVETKQFGDGMGKLVKHGNTIKIIPLDNGRQRSYKLSSEFKKKFPDIYDELIGKKINSVVTIRDGKFKIKEIV